LFFGLFIYLIDIVFWVFNPTKVTPPKFQGLQIFFIFSFNYINL